MESRDVTGLK